VADADRHSDMNDNSGSAANNAAAGSSDAPVAVGAGPGAPAPALRGRPKQSPVRALLKFCGSLQFAMLLLFMITVMSMWGTIVESSFTAEVAKKHIYNSVLFDVWLVMLCINLTCAAAVRYPWKRHQHGFVITHAGIIILLTGGFIDRHWGIEGFIPLYRGEPATDVLELHEQTLLVWRATTGARAGDTAPAETRMNLKELTGDGDLGFTVNTPDPSIKVEVEDLTPPAIRLVLSGAKMGRIEQWLFLGDNLNMGPATMRFTTGLPPEPKVAAPAEKPTGNLVPRLERTIAFAKHDIPFSKAMQGEPTGVKTHLLMDETGQKPTLELNVFGKTFSFDVKDVLKKRVPLPGMPEWTIYIYGYYHNFVLNQDNQPDNRNDQPENPAVTFELQGPYVPASAEPEDNPHGAPSLDKMDPTANMLVFYLGGDGKLRYFVKSRVKGESAGEVEEGKGVLAGWAGDASFTVEKFVPFGFTDLLREDAKKLAAFRKVHPNDLYTSEMPPSKRMETRPMGVLCKVTADNETRHVWVPLSTSQMPRREYVQVGKEALALALPRRAVRLPFKIALEKFIARPQPGMSGQGVFESFESTLSFQDKPDVKRGILTEPAKQLDTLYLKPGSIAIQQLGPEHASANDPSVFENVAIADIQPTYLIVQIGDKESKIANENVVRYEKQTHKIYMNHPTTYPQTAIAPFFGTNYKFSQADHQWGVNNDYSGIQVLRDPGWFFKWFGCIMICFGIFTMFYLKPYFNRPKAEVAMAIAAAHSLSKKDKKKNKKQKEGGAELGHASGE
jgi:hypothetical protein